MADRDASGRFIKGNKIAKNGGRPKRAFEERIYNRLICAITNKDWDDIRKAVVKKAKEGNMSAVKFLASHAIGLPIQRSVVDVTTSAAPIPMDVAKEIVAARLAMVDGIRVTVEVPTERTPVKSVKKEKL